MRASGILMPVFSLPSRYGIGSFSKSAYQFVDMLKKAGQKYWQILPLCPTSYGDSPYQSFSTYAGNPYFIDLDQLIEEKLLTRKECQACDFGDDPQDIDYGKLYENRFKLLRKAYERANVGEDQEFEAYRRENAWWLDDYALFMAVKDRFDGVAWNEWAEDIRLRWSNAMDYYRRKTEFIPAVKEAFERLESQYDAIVLEGAGSPAEINLRDNDIVNMLSWMVLQMEK